MNDIEIEFTLFYNVHVLQNLKHHHQVRLLEHAIQHVIVYVCPYLSVIVHLSPSLEVNPPTREFRVSLCLEDTRRIFSVAFMIYNCAIGTLIIRGHSNNRNYYNIVLSWDYTIMSRGINRLM